MYEISMNLEEDVKIEEEDNPITSLRLSKFRRELREFRRKMKLIKSVEQNYPVKKNQSPPPCKPYEILKLVQKLEKEGLIPKPSYRLGYYPQYKFILSQ